MGALSGAVGTYSANGPEIEAAVLDRLGLEREDVSTQVVARDRHAELLTAIAVAGAGFKERFATEIPQPAEDRGARGGRAIRQRPAEGIERDAPQTQPDHLRARLTGLARVLRGKCSGGGGKRCAVAERDISHSGAERVILPDSTVLLTTCSHSQRRYVNGMTVHADRMQANLDATTARVFTACAAGSD